MSQRATPKVRCYESVVGATLSCSPLEEIGLYMDIKRLILERRMGRNHPVNCPCPGRDENIKGSDQSPMPCQGSVPRSGSSSVLNVWRLSCKRRMKACNGASPIDEAAIESGELAGETWFCGRVIGTSPVDQLMSLLTCRDASCCELRYKPMDNITRSWVHDDLLAVPHLWLASSHSAFWRTGSLA